MSIKKRVLAGITSATIMCTSLVVTAFAETEDKTTGSCGNTSIVADLIQTSSGVVAVISTSGAAPSSTSVDLSYTYRIPSGGPQVTSTSSGTSRAEISINYTHYPVSASADYLVTNGSAKWEDSLDLTF